MYRTPILLVLGILVGCSTAYGQPAADKAPEAKVEKPAGQKDDESKDKPKGRKPENFRVDDMLAFFQSGIARQRGKPNRTFTVGELEAKFGEPTQRLDNRPAKGYETWKYQCKDGRVQVRLRQVGYAGGDKTRSLRLRLVTVEGDRQETDQKDESN